MSVCSTNGIGLTKGHRKKLSRPVGIEPKTGYRLQGQTRSMSISWQWICISGGKGFAKLCFLEVLRHERRLFEKVCMLHSTVLF